MKKAILGKKIGMTQLILDNGVVLPVTVVLAEPNVVVHKKNVETDGYEAVQVGFCDIEARKVSKPLKGHFNKAGVQFKRFLREFKFDDCSSFNAGDEIKVDIFAEGDLVDVCALTKGKGFSGTVKRWGTHRGPMSHGSNYHRGPGSMGGCSDPSRVFKGKKLPGRYGSERVTVQNLTIAKVIADKNVILIKGAVPGPKGGLVTVTNNVKG